MLFLKYKELLLLLLVSKLIVSFEAGITEINPQEIIQFKEEKYFVLSRDLQNLILNNSQFKFSKKSKKICNEIKNSSLILKEHALFLIKEYLSFNLKNRNIEMFLNSYKKFLKSDQSNILSVKPIK